MDDSTSDDRKKGPAKTPKGAGYTTRVDGKKKLTTSLLEQQLEQAQAKLRELQQQNKLLRIKESMQLETLEGAEMAVHYMGSLAQAAAGSQQTMQCLLPAVLLDMQALELKQALQPYPQQQQHSQVLPAANPQEAQVLLASAFATVQAARAAAAHSAGGAVSGSSSGSGSGSSDAAEVAWSAGPGGPSGRRMQRLMASITLEEVQEARALSLQGMAERVRDTIIAITKARREMDEEAAPGPATEALSASVSDAVDQNIRSHMLSVLSDEPRHCELIGLNLETMHRQVPSDEVWLESVHAAQLQPQQLQHIAMAFQTSAQQQAELLQEQQAIMQQLQALLGASAAGPDQDDAAAADCAADDDDNDQEEEYAGSASGEATHTAAAASAPMAPAADDAGLAAAAAAATVTIARRARAGVRKTSTAAAAAASGCSSTGHQQVKSEPAAAADTPQTAASHIKLDIKLEGSEASTGFFGAATAGSNVSTGADSQTSQASGSGTPAAAAGGAAAEAAAAASAAGSSGSSGGGMPGGVLAVEDAEQAERLLKEWHRVCWAMKRQGRLLAAMLMNMMSSEQWADATIAAYPYIIPAPKFCACAVQTMAQKQEGNRKPQHQKDRIKP